MYVNNSNVVSNQYKLEEAMNISNEQKHEHKYEYK